MNIIQFNTRSRKDYVYFLIVDSLRYNYRPCECVWSKRWTTKMSFITYGSHKRTNNNNFKTLSPTKWLLWFIMKFRFRKHFTKSNKTKQEEYIEPEKILVLSKYLSLVLVNTGITKNYTRTIYNWCKWK